MKFIIKEISPSRKELRLVLNSSNVNGINSYVLGTVNSNFDNGSVDPKYIPLDSSLFYSVGPQPAIIRVLVAYLKDYFENRGDYSDLLLITSKNENLPIINIAVDDIDITYITSDVLPSVVIKLSIPLPDNLKALDELTIENQVIVSQEQEFYYLPESTPKPELHGLDYDESMIDEVGSADNRDLSYKSYEEVTGSFKQTDLTVLHDMLSGSDLNLKVDYRNYENHTHFGSAVSKLENFKYKVSQIEEL